MIAWGKIIGTILGFMLLGFIGACLGFFLGHQFDLAYRRLGFASLNHAEHVRVQAIFFSTTFQVMGYIAKSDGYVSENAIRVARSVMGKMWLNESQRQEAIRYFTEGKQPQFNLDQSLYLLKQNCRQNPMLLQMFIEIQFQAAHADGHISAGKERALNHICQLLGIRVNFANFNYGFGSQYQAGDGRRPASTVSRLDEAYALLGISPNATDAEVKRAYRRQMSQNHPDKLVAKGLPDAMMKLATEKTQKIQAAYEQICAARA